ncbi:MAG: PQQ-binding-like beta-propeller repeat protein [Archangiaceae bacterium]|nr:PQQ-binding-like beta-propeller repeat protein [Archangiaceae bacterium]
MSRTCANLSLALLLLVVACKGAAPKAFELAAGAPSFVGLVDARPCAISVTDVGGVRCVEPSGLLTWHADVCRPVRQRPTVIGGTLWVACDDGEWSALDVKTGKQRWKQTGRPVPAGALVSDGQVGFLAGRAGELEAIDETGLSLWSASGGPRLWAGAGAVMSAGPKGLVVFQAGTGDRLWSDDKPAVALGGNDELVVAARAAGDLVAWDLASGHVRWGVTLGAFAVDSLWVSEKTLSVGLANGDLVELATLDGAEVSRVRLAAALAAPVVDGVAVLQGREGCAVVLATSTSVCVDHQLRGSAVVRDGVLMLSPRDGRVLGFRLDGSKRQ